MFVSVHINGLYGNCSTNYYRNVDLDCSGLSSGGNMAKQTGSAVKLGFCYTMQWFSHYMQNKYLWSSRYCHTKFVTFKLPNENLNCKVCIFQIQTYHMFGLHPSVQTRNLFFSPNEMKSSHQCFSEVVR